MILPGAGNSLTTKISTYNKNSKDEKDMVDLIEKSQSKQAPEFSGVDTEGRTVQLSAFRGKSNVVLVLNRGFG